jgi:DHA2 family multidrug resistance protein-like MFS transporter
VTASAVDAAPHGYRGTDALIVGIVLAVITFWLFAQTTLNIAPAIRDSLAITESLTNMAVSITALFSGIFIVVAGGLADRCGPLRPSEAHKRRPCSERRRLVADCRLAGWHPTFLITGRVIQGMSAACIMPATLALMKAYFDGKERQRALSYWSIGSWGGSGASALFGGLVASSVGWRWIFWLSILVAVVSFVLIRGTPESKVQSGDAVRFDWYGFTAFTIGMVAVNVVIGQGAVLGWQSPTVIVLTVLFVVAAVVFFKVDSDYPDGFVDLTLFKNKTYTGATLSNFLINGAAGTLLVALSLVQQEAGLSSLESGLLTVGYLVAILSTIRLGEKLLQRMGPRNPMLIGCGVTAAGILLTTFTFLLARQYMVVAFLGFTLFGVGLGVYATPSTDAALSNVPQDKAGAASGVYKMASSLGAAFGVAVSAALFTGLASLGDGFGLSDLFLGRTDNIDVRFAAAIALLFNVLMAIMAILAIGVTVPRNGPSTAASRLGPSR